MYHLFTTFKKKIETQASLYKLFEFSFALCTLQNKVLTIKHENVCKK